jgi:vancomycin resistance protein YoaR
VFALSLSLGLLVSFLWEAREAGERVPRGVVLRHQGRDRPLGGLPPASLRQVLEAQRRELLGTRVDVELADRTFVASLGELGVEVDVAGLGDAALHAGQNGGPLQRVGWWLGRLGAVAPLELAPRIDVARLRERLGAWEKAAWPAAPEAPRVVFHGELRAEYGGVVRHVDVPATVVVLERHLRDGGTGPLRVPVREEPPPVTRDEVDARLAEAQRLLAGPLVLTTESGVGQLQLTPADLAAALSTRLDESTPPRLLFALDLTKLEARLQKLRAEIERPAEPARFSIDGSHRVSVLPSRTGERIDVDALLGALLAAAQTAQRQGPLPLQVETPPLTTEEAESLNVHKLVAHFATRHPCCEARVKNIHFAASQADGVLLRPGERFSLNELLGPRTNEGGFLDAPAIVRGKMKETPGGGISQFATTLFNAVLDGGYEILQRQPHTYYFSRYPEGHEATVSFPVPDLVFRNDTKSGLLIKTQYDATTLRVLLYGDNEGRRVERRISKRFDIVEPPVEYEPNEELVPEKTRRKAAGQIGWSVLATRVIHYPDGQSVEQTRRVTYSPRPEVVEVHPCKIPKGLKGASGKPCPEPVTPEENTPEEQAGDTPAAPPSEAPPERDGLSRAPADP